jgi:hypothetical protein
MSYYLFLDDERPTPDIGGKIIVCKNYEQFVQCITDNGMPRRISFDHDLTIRSGTIEKTGLDCAKWLVQHCIDNDLDLPGVGVHSMNPAGSDNIKSVLRSYARFRSENKEKGKRNDHATTD